MKRRFGEVGLEQTADGSSYVMAIAGESVIILSTPSASIPGLEFTPGLITYAISTTEWGQRSDIDTAEALGLYEYDPKAPQSY